VNRTIENAHWSRQQPMDRRGRGTIAIPAEVSVDTSIWDLTKGFIYAVIAIRQLGSRKGSSHGAEDERNRPSSAASMADNAVTVGAAKRARPNGSQAEQGECK